MVLGLVLATGALDVRASTPIQEGFRDFSYPPGTGGSSRGPSGDKPESKLWFNDGVWWAVLWSTAGSEYRIHRLNHATQSWDDTGAPVDDRSDTRSDSLWDGSKLYVVSHVFSTTGGATGPGDSGQLFRYSYQANSQVYSLDSGFPVTVNDSLGETLVIAKDSTSTLWITYVDSGQVMVNHSVGGNDTDWSSPPFALPFPEATNLTSDDISSVVAFDGHVGVLWSNQTTFEMYFAAHADGDGSGSWNLQTGTATLIFDRADDHINLKSLSSDPAGKVFATIKTELDEMVLLVCTGSDCQSDTNWQSSIAYTADRTRPIVLIDTTNRELYMITTFCCPRDIRATRTDLDAIDFSPPVEEVVIQELTSGQINDPTSFKDPMDAASGMVVLGSSHTGSPEFYYHTFLDLVAATFTSVESGLPGNIVTLTGAHFATASAVDFTGAPGATFSVVSDTQIDVTVPVGAQTGPVSVTNSTGAGSSSPLEFVLEVVPTVTGLAPTSGVVGAAVTLTGTGFTGTTAVDFTGAPGAVFSLVSDTQIDATVPVGALTGPVSVTNSAGTGSSGVFVIEVAPAVTGIAPPSGIVGTAVTLTGTGFTGTTAVDFTSAPGAAFSVVSDTQIDTTVPVGAQTGPISVTNSAGAGSSGAFVVIVVPSVTGLAPTSGIVGTAVTLTGTGFTGTTAVDFTSAPGVAFSVISDTQIDVTVPVGTQTGPVSVTNSAGTGSSGAFVIEVAPAVTGLAPASGAVGAAVTLTGTGFTGTTAVDFTAAPGAAFSLVSDTQIDATVPVGAQTGPVSVTNSAGTGSSGTFVIEVVPAVTGLAPASGIVGVAVTLTGTGFTGASAVDFTGAAGASFSLISDTQIDVTVPVGAQTGPVSVTNSAGTGSSGAFVIEVVPAVTGLAPASGIAGTAVILTGTGLTGASAVDFTGAAGASFSLVSDTQIDVTVPVGAQTGPVSVTNSAGTGSSGAFVIETVPIVTGFAPASGIVGTPVTLTGTGFTGTIAVDFTGAPDAAFGLVSDTQIDAIVPVGAETGPISVINSAGTGSSSVFVVDPIPQVDALTTWNTLFLAALMLALGRWQLVKARSRGR